MRPHLIYNAVVDIVEQLRTRGFDCLCGNIRMASRAITSVYDRHLAAAGIQASQLAVLWAVSNARGVSVKELAGEVAMHETTLIRNLRLLEREGWVRIAPGVDKRQRIASLTPRGRGVFKKALPLWKKAQLEVASALDEPAPAAAKRLVRLARVLWS